MLTETEKLQADINGWIVCEVYDLDTSRWRVQVLPGPNSQIKNAADLLRVVSARASANDALAIRIVRLVMDSHAPTKKARKK